MFKNLKIKNFQSHKETNIEFASNGVTALVGSGDKGKTACLRALYWIANNRPLGKTFVRHRSDGEVQSTLTLDNDTTITRQKGKQNNYLLNGEVLEALGSDVPQRTQDALGLSSINIQMQFDGYYLIFDSPGKVAAAINDIVHLEDAEQVGKSLSSRLREVAAQTRGHKEGVASCQLGLNKYKRLDEYVNIVSKAVSVDGNITALKTDKSRLERILTSLTGILTAISAIDIPAGIEDLLNGVEREVNFFGQLNKESRELGLFLIGMEKVIHDLALKDTKEIEAAENKIDIFYAELKKQTDEANRLFDLEGAIQKVISIIDIEGDSLVALNKEYKGLLGQLTECPICGQELDNSHLELVLENMV